MYSATITLANVNIGLCVYCLETVTRFHNFVTNNSPDFRIFISEERLAIEKSILAKKYPGDHFFVHDYEFNALYRDIPTLLFNKKILIFHGVLIRKDNKGYLFTAPPGTGKTTHVKYWKDLFDDEVQIINGDKPLLKIEKDGLFGYGSPWTGKEGYGTNERIRINFICHIHRGEHSSIQKVNSINDAIEWLLNGVMLKDREHHTLEIIHWLKNALQHVSIFELTCNLNIESARIAYCGMNDEKE